MGTTSERFFDQTAAVETTLTPEEVYEVAANPELLPRWWFHDDPTSRIWDGTRVPREVDEAGLAATPGASVEIVSSGAKNEVFAKRRWTELPSVIRFTCEIAESGARVRLTHQTVHGEKAQHQVSTDVRISSQRGVTGVEVSQRTVARGRGPGALLARWAQARFDHPTRQTLDGLIEVAKSATRPAP